MPLPAPELETVERLSAEVEASVVELCSAPWKDRAHIAAIQLEKIHAAWWERHASDPDAYARDLAGLNRLAKWQGPYAQVASAVRDGKQYLTPPKFFGGDPRGLSEDFILAVSLNHAMPENEAYVAELADFQYRLTCLEAHRGYFRRPYAYERFFRPRAKLLTAYGRARGDAATTTDWRFLNQTYSLYLERYPTLSPKCCEASEAHELLEREVFVMALNAVAHRVVIQLLRPRCALLAGKATWALLPSAAPRDVSARIRRDQRLRCRATIDEVALGEGAAACKVLRCSFLRTVFGPNSDDELAAVGELLGES